MKRGILFISLFLFSILQAHSGRTDSSGGHHSKNGGYHYHGGAATSSSGTFNPYAAERLGPSASNNKTKNKSDDSSNLEKLQSEINSLRIKLQKQTDLVNQLKTTCLNLKKENKMMRQMLGDANIVLPKEVSTFEDVNEDIPSEKPQLENNVIYLGKPRTQKWFNLMYERFHTKIICAGDKYVSIDKKNIIKGISNTPQPQGTVIDVDSDDYRVIQVLNSNEAIMAREVIRYIQTKSYGTFSPYSSGQISGAGGVRRLPDELGDYFLLKNYEGELVDEQQYKHHGCFISDGLYSYTNSLNEPTTIQSFIQCLPVTKEQFTDALRNGLELYQEVGGARKLIP
jgi:hypothetical protein